MARPSASAVLGLTLLTVFGPRAVGGQLCGTAAGASSGRCSAGNKASITLEVPFGKAALWALAKVPTTCSQPEGACNWFGAADAWRYIWNNLRLAVAASPDRQALGEENLLQVHNFFRQMQHNVGMFAGSWGQADAPARQMLDMLRPWIESSPDTALSLPRTNIGTQFPTLGRSVSVPTNGDMASTVTLANGYPMPVLGFGVWQLPADGTCYQSTLWALQLGYRHIDTAQGYGNEHEVGRAMKDSGVPREEICLVTKLSQPGEYRTARQRFEQQLRSLGVDYVDVYMLHSPGGSKEDRQAAWTQMEALYDEGKIKALGVSNFDINLLKELLSFARIRPVYLQNKYSIYQPGSGDEALKGESLMEWLAMEKIVMTGYSIIHPGHGGYLSPLEDPHVKAIAARHGRTPSQVLHRWLLQLGAAVIPRSSKRERIRENGDLFTFALEDADMRLLNGISSLLSSIPGTRAPAWCEDVYGVEKL
eukprot:TRINITY_DN11073_c0_g4_i1.p1 TRINITY_DN11073_c0_g4~~TRINITY_DN11073_c0_g4_i1.p1  ORF type:complete len:478 (-),score=98.72 TRINITY_DN11073_c0_g4_i1:82-1515(-)